MNAIAEFEVENNSVYFVDQGVAVYNANTLMAIAGGANLEEYNILSSCTTINAYSVSNSSLKKLIVPPDVQFIRASCIYMCQKLEIIVFKAVVPVNVSGSGFISGTISSKLKIYVPDASIDAYKIKTGYSTYADKIFGISQMS
jgi:hypothetical protein